MQIVSRAMTGALASIADDIQAQSDSALQESMIKLSSSRATFERREAELLAELSDSKAKLGELNDENSVIKASLESAQKNEGEFTQFLAAAIEQEKQ